MNIVGTQGEFDSVQMSNSTQRDRNSRFDPSRLRSLKPGAVFEGKLKSQS